MLAQHKKGKNAAKEQRTLKLETRRAGFDGG
jgi:hypothetical protein